MDLYRLVKISMSALMYNCRKSGRFLGRKAKTRLGTGSVVHTTSCATYTDVLGVKAVHRKVGGIMIIVGCRWGPSIRKFDPDWLGKKGASAGVLTKLTLCTEEKKATSVSLEATGL